MTKQTKRYALILLLVGSTVFGLTPPPAAQGEPFKVGERVEYKELGYPEVWEEGEVLKLYPASGQVLIRMKPAEFYSTGFERIFRLAEVRPLTIRLAQAPAPYPKEPPRLTERGEATAAERAELLTAQEIISYLQTRLGHLAWQHPQREFRLIELATMIKRRGVNFRYTEGGPEFLAVAGRYGLLASELGTVIEWNYGPPATVDWLMGTWQMVKADEPVDFARNGALTQPDTMSPTAGSLTINPNQTYRWQSPAGHAAAGRWRAATKQEMKYQGGAGIVLEKAKGGTEWIVSKRPWPGAKAPGLIVAQVANRTVREFATSSGRNQPQE